MSEYEAIATALGIGIPVMIFVLSALFVRWFVGWR